MKNKIKHIDLFAGCGGLTDGFEQTNLYETVACVEWEKIPCKTLIKRLEEKWEVKEAGERVLNFDIQRTDELINGWSEDPSFGSSKGLKQLVEKKDGVDVIIGGPPCQAYSIAGRIRDANGMNDDYRNYLFESYLKIVSYFKPKAFIFENVPGMLSAKPGGISIVDRITSDFKKNGYIITGDLKKMALIDCSKYGVPQSRQRIIILGVNKKMFRHNPNLALSDFYQNLLTKYKSDKTKTVHDAIGNMPKLFPLKKPIKHEGRSYSHDFISNGFSNHIPRMHNARDIRTFKMLASDIESGREKYVSTESLKDLYFRLTGKRSNIHKYNVLRWNKPSNTIPAHLYKDGLRHIHPDPLQARTITVREAARLQSFSDDFEFCGSMSDQYKMIGNAVPPEFAKAVAYALNDFIEKYS